MEVQKSLRKVRKPKDKPGERIQVSIKNFLRKVQEVEVGKDENIVNKASPREKTLKPLSLKNSGARTKPGLGQRTSKPTNGPSSKVGGKLVEGNKKEGIRTVGPLERWLLPLGKNTGSSGTSGHGKGDQE